MDKFFRDLHDEYRRWEFEQQYWAEDQVLYHLYRDAMQKEFGVITDRWTNRVEEYKVQYGAEAIYQAVLKERLRHGRVL